MHARYETIDRRPALRFERQLNHPVAMVWEALTEPSELAHWFPCEVEVELRVGGLMKFEFREMTLPETASTMFGEVTELDPPRRFSFLWGEDHLHFALEPSGDGDACVLRFTVELDARDKAARDAAGWHLCLDALERRLGGSDQGPTTGANGPWREIYDEYQRRGVPAGAPIPGQ
jgi:uncharacterized protein YndB with AHSA1/START domain